VPGAGWRVPDVECRVPVLEGDLTLGRRAKRTKEAPRAPTAAAANLPHDQATASKWATDDQINFNNLSLHDLFEQQARTMLGRADIDEEHKQSILIAMSCPCCGAGGMSFTVKLKK
jgi:hypothetical protein